MSEISNRILKLITDNSISYGDLSSTTNIPKSALQRYATGETEKIPIDRVQILARALGSTAAYLMGWQDSPRLEVDKGEKALACPQERQLISNYRKLNKEARDRLLAQSDDMVQSGKYSPRIETIATSEKYKIKSSTIRSEYEQEADEFAKMAREQFLLEKKQEEKAYSAKELDAG